MVEYLNVVAIVRSYSGHHRTRENQQTLGKTGDRGTPMMEVARWLVAFVSAGTGVGALCVDYLMSTGRQHIRNPRWPPHAKFHNGQTIMMGLIQGVLALVLLFEPGRLTLGRLLLAAIISSIYWLALFGARLFPGTAWTDPEFEAETTKPLGFHLQQILGLALLAILAAAVALAFLSGCS